MACSAIAVPKDFGNKKLTWTLVANGQTAAVQLSLNPAYWVDHFKNPATGQRAAGREVRP